MANAYTSEYAGIKSKMEPEAQKMCAVLNSLENVEHKTSIAEWVMNKTSETKYPSCAAVNQAVNEVKSAADSRLAIVESKLNSMKLTTVESITSSSTNTQVPTAKAVWDLLNNNRYFILNVSPYTNVKLSRFEMKSSLSSTICTWYEAVNLGVTATRNASDVPQSVKNYINTTWGSGTISNDNCLAYLKYAHTTPKVWRLPTEAEWVYGRNNGMFGALNAYQYEWCCDASGSQVTSSPNPVNWGSSSNDRVLRLGSNSGTRTTNYPSDSIYYYYVGGRDGYDCSCGCRLARRL